MIQAFHMIFLSFAHAGMYLIGAVQNGNVYFNNRQWYTLNKEKNTVCIQFDRGCIVSTDCSCKSTCKWCEHVVTLCTARMNGLLPFEVHPPLSEILTGFNKDQLVKLIQNCCVHPMGDFSRLFALAVQLKDKESEINEQCGAPGQLSVHAIRICTQSILFVHFHTVTVLGTDNWYIPWPCMHLLNLEVFLKLQTA